MLFVTQEEVTSAQPIQFGIEIIYNGKFDHVLSVDVHPMKPWIMTSHHGGQIFIWNYHTQATVNSFDFIEEPDMLSDLICISFLVNNHANIVVRTAVYLAKFIEQEQWLVAGDGEGNIYVYSYDTKQKIISFEAHDTRIESLAVHPTLPFVLSSSDDHQIKLWDWDKGWECTGIFEGHSDRVMQITFNPVDNNSFASASLDQTVKIWSLSSSKSKITLREHPDSLQCAHYFVRDTRHYLITGFWDGTAQIWDLETEKCVKTLKRHVDRLGCVYHHAELSMLITGSFDGTVRLWNSNTYRLDNIIGFNLGAVYAVGYVKEIRRIVVGCQQGIAIIGN